MSTSRSLPGHLLPVFCLSIAQFLVMTTDAVGLPLQQRSAGSGADPEIHESWDAVYIGESKVGFTHTLSVP